MRSVPLLDASSSTVAGPGRLKSETPRYAGPGTAAPALDPEPPFGARPEEGPPAGCVPGRRLQWPAGPVGPGDERRGRPGRERSDHLPADHQPGGPLHLGHGPVEPESFAVGQARPPPPLGQDADRAREDLGGGAPLREVRHRLSLGGPAQLGDALQCGELGLAVGERVDGQRNGPGLAQAAQRIQAARRTPGSGSRTSSRSRSPAAFRPSAPRPRRPPGARPGPGP